MSNYILETVNLSKEELKDILNKIKNVRLGIIGDGCIDIYWDADMTLSELSRETPHYPLPVIGERISLGAAANVAINMKKIGAKFVTMVTLVGDDWRGEELKKLLRINDIDETNVVKSQTRITPAYCKPMRIRGWILRIGPGYHQKMKPGFSSN